MKQSFFLNLFVSALFISALSAEEIPGVPRDSNFNNTGGYDSTRVEAQLIMMVKENTRQVHFIRDNNDPRVVTKTYILKHADPYEIRDYLRQMVQAKRIGNTSMQQQYTGNTASGPSVTAEASYPVLTTPPNASMSYNPQLQQGSNTAVECIKYMDGTGLLLISAEDYRFEDHENGMGFDSLVEFLDRPGMGNSTGTQVFLYLPKFVPARNLMPMIENVGMNISDVTELWQGQDLVVTDPDLNWLIFDVSNYSCTNISNLLKQYDVPIPQVKISISVYEVYDEDDEKMGVDFQNWKNNAGTDFFSVGGRYRNNWAAAYGGAMAKSFGSERTSYYNFNPKWNTRYLDFLVSKGKANVAITGELLVRNNTSAKFDRTTQLMYISTQDPLPGTLEDLSNAPGPYKLLSTLIGQAVGSPDIPVEKGERQETVAFAGFGFSMTVNNASVNLAETRLNLTLSNSSLIGFESDGTPRISDNNTITQDVSLPFGKDTFVIGGLKKQDRVVSKTGVPFLMDIPYLGLLFSTESISVKHAELIIVASCDWDSPSEKGVYVTAEENKIAQQSEQ